MKAFKVYDTKHNGHIFPIMEKNSATDADVKSVIAWFADCHAGKNDGFVLVVNDCGNMTVFNS